MIQIFNKRKWLLNIFLLIFLVSCGTEKERPNIIFIMSDDHAYQAISAYGYNLNHTPNIDRIAEEGVIFKRGYVTNSICAPSRAVMLTGKHSFVNGKIDNRNKFDWSQDNVAKKLRSAGYQTALVGKIHIHGIPQGFDYYNILPGQGQYYNPDFIENGTKRKYQGYCTTITTDIAMDWLKNKREKDKPFFLMYHQKAPHRTWMPEEKYLDLYSDTIFYPPSNFFDDYTGRNPASQHEMGIYKHMDMVYDLKMLDDEKEIASKYRHVGQNLHNRLDEKQRAVWDAHYKPIIKEFKEKEFNEEELALWKYNRYMKDYLATIQSVDDGVGELLDYLETAGLSENTIIVYTSDQGFYLGEHGWFDKRFMYEESFRTPILMKYPKEIKAGTVNEKLVQNLDFSPTFMDYAGVDIPVDVQGKSFRDIVNGKTNKWRDAIYYTYYEYPGEHNVYRHHGVCTERYKLIHFYYPTESWELYDLKEDLNEMNNVYNNPEYAKVQKEMHIKLENIRKQYGDSDQLDKSFISNYNEKVKQ